MEEKAGSRVSRNITSASFAAAKMSGYDEVVPLHILPRAPTILRDNSRAHPYSVEDAVASEAVLDGRRQGTESGGYTLQTVRGVHAALGSARAQLRALCTDRSIHADNRRSLRTRNGQEERTCAICMY